MAPTRTGRRGGGGAGTSWSGPAAAIRSIPGPAESALAHENQDDATSNHVTGQHRHTPAGGPPGASRARPAASQRRPPAPRPRYGPWAGPAPGGTGPSVPRGPCGRHSRPKWAPLQGVPHAFRGKRPLGRPRSGLPGRPQRARRRGPTEFRAWAGRPAKGVRQESRGPAPRENPGFFFAKQPSCLEPQRGSSRPRCPPSPSERRPGEYEPPGGIAGGAGPLCRAGPRGGPCRSAPPPSRPLVAPGKVAGKACPRHITAARERAPLGIGGCGGRATPVDADHIGDSGSPCALRACWPGLGRREGRTGEGRGAGAGCVVFCMDAT